MPSPFRVARLVTIALVCGVLASCASERDKDTPLTKDDYTQIILLTLQHEQLQSPETVFLEVKDMNAADLVPALKAGLGAGIVVKPTTEDRKLGSAIGCDSDKVTHTRAISVSFSSPALSFGRAILKINFRSCSIDARTDDYVFHKLGDVWNIEDIHPGSYG